MKATFHEFGVGIAWKPMQKPFFVSFLSHNFNALRFRPGECKTGLLTQLVQRGALYLTVAALCAFEPCSAMRYTLMFAVQMRFKVSQ